MEWLTRRIVWTIVGVLIAAAIAVAIWEAIPAVIKVLAILGIVGGFIKILK